MGKKTGWKYTKQSAQSKSKTNMIRKSNASSVPGRTAPKMNDRNMRSAETIARLKMYAGGKAIRNKEGKIVGGRYMMKDRAGDAEITSATGRIQPDRRWFGNTRVVNPADLDKFREEMTERVSDPYSVVLKRKKLPMGLLRDVAEAATASATNNGSGLLANEPFEHTFGSKSRRKRVKLDQLLVGRTVDELEKKKKNGNKGTNKKEEGEEGSKGGDGLNVQVKPGGSAWPVKQIQTDNDTEGYAALLSAAQKSSETYEEINTREGIVPWGRDSNLDVTSGEGVEWRSEPKDDLFLKGQSKRIWGEFFKVVDCSDVILHVIDARNVPGTRCTMIERHVAKNASHKHLVFVLNKMDLVPNWVAKRWIGELAKVRPTIAFHASMTHAFGKGALISLLRQFGKLHSDKKQISVGVVGYPNVGKSSVINTLLSKKSCKVAPIPGETKIWQYISLFRNIHLIDCPGVVVDTAGDTEVDSVLKGVVRSERLESPEDFVEPILERVRREHIAAHYGLPKDGDDTWKNGEHLMEMIATKSGRLLKGGEPCLRSAAIMLINDFQRGRLPHYVPPPELKEDEPPAVETAAAKADGIKGIEQDLDAIGEEAMGDGKGDVTRKVDAGKAGKQHAGGEDGVCESDGSGDDEEDYESESDSDDEGNVAPAAVIGSGDWDDEN